MKVEEARKSVGYPKLTGILAILPDDAFIDIETFHSAYYLGMKLEVNTTISCEVVEDITKGGSLIWLVTDWYRKMHEELIQSEINWNKKMQLRR